MKQITICDVRMFKKKNQAHSKADKTIDQEQQQTSTHNLRLFKGFKQFEFNTLNTLTSQWVKWVLYLADVYVQYMY